MCRNELRAMKKGKVGRKGEDEGEVHGEERCGKERYASERREKGGR